MSGREAEATAAAGRRPGSEEDAPSAPSARALEADPGDLVLRKVNVHYGDKHAVKDVDMTIRKNRVTAFIGPSGCGKSTLLRCLNRMNDEIPGCRTEGSIEWQGIDILDRRIDPAAIRRKIGMVFQKPNPFPRSVYRNVAFGPQIHGRLLKAQLDELVERKLRAAVLWEEVKDRLDEHAMGLSGGQQQRLCIARALAVDPEVILMDEPCSALDPIATAKIEDLIDDLKKEYTVVMVTHNMQQAARVSDHTGFMYLGRLIEVGETRQMFESPRKRLTERYLTGRFG